MPECYICICVCVCVCTSNKRRTTQYFSNMFKKSDLDCKIMGYRKSRNPAVPGYWFKLRGRIFQALSLIQTSAMFEIIFIEEPFIGFLYRVVFFQSLTPILIRQNGPWNFIIPTPGRSEGRDFQAFLKVLTHGVFKHVFENPGHMPINKVGPWILDVEKAAPPFSFFSLPYLSGCQFKIIWQKLDIRTK